MKLFESCYTRHNVSTLTSPLSPAVARHVVHEVTLPLIWKSQALLCKDPLSGYMNATHLPKEIIEMIMLYVGLINIHPKSGSYREMNMNSMRKIIEREKGVVVNSPWSQVTSFMGKITDNHEIILYGTIVLILAISFGNYAVFSSWKFS